MKKILSLLIILMLQANIVSATVGSDVFSDANQRVAPTVYNCATLIGIAVDTTVDSLSMIVSGLGLVPSKTPIAGDKSESNSDSAPEAQILVLNVGSTFGTRLVSNKLHEKAINSLYFQADSASDGYPVAGLLLFSALFLGMYRRKIIYAQMYVSSGYRASDIIFNT